MRSSAVSVSRSSSPPRSWRSPRSSCSRSFPHARSRPRPRRAPRWRASRRSPSPRRRVRSRRTPRVQHDDMERGPDAHTDAGRDSSMSTVTDRPRPGRHRSASADAAILDATLELLRERGYRALTVAAVIERAGVSSATLYRRWPSKPELVAAAIASLVPESFEVDTGTLRGDMSAFVHHVADSIAARGNIIELLGAGASEDTEL